MRTAWLTSYREAELHAINIFRSLEYLGVLRVYLFVKGDMGSVFPIKYKLEANSSYLNAGIRGDSHVFPEGRPSFRPKFLNTIPVYHISDRTSSVATTTYLYRKVDQQSPYRIGFAGIRN